MAAVSLTVEIEDLRVELEFSLHEEVFMFGLELKRLSQIQFYLELGSLGTLNNEFSDLR